MLGWNIHAAHTALQASTHLSEVYPSTQKKQPNIWGSSSKTCMICIEIIEIIATSSTDSPTQGQSRYGCFYDVGLCSLMGVCLTYDEDLAGWPVTAHLCNQRPCFPKTSSHEKFKGPPERREIQQTPDDMNHI